MRSAYLITNILLFLASCVPASKFKDLTSQHNQARTELDSLRRIADEKRYLDYEVRRKDQDYKKLQDDLADQQARYKSLNDSYKDVLKRYDELLNQNQAILNESTDTRSQLEQKLAQKQAELDKREREQNDKAIKLNQLEQDLAEKEAAVEALRKSTSEYEAKVNQLQSQLKAQQSMISDLQAKVSNALRGFSAKDLTVTEKNGKIYVTLSQNLLFASGSDKIDPKGVNALKQLAGALQKNPDIQINVEGHTDNTGDAGLNWDLSTRRATAVVKILTTNGVEPKNVTASGRGMYFPVAENTTADGKGKNRRTEIILSPKLDELFNLIRQ